MGPTVSTVIEHDAAKKVTFRYGVVATYARAQMICF